MIILSISLGQPIKTIFGHNACWIFWLFGMFHNMSMVTGSSFMAIYRMTCITNPNYVMNVRMGKQLAQQILFMENSATLGLIAIASIGGMISETNLNVSFCQGYSMKMSQILLGHTFNPDGLKIIGLAIFLGFCLVITELVCYIAIFSELYQNDQNMTDILADKILHQRRNRNVTTLSGQVACFATKSFVVIVTLTMFKSYLDPSLFPIMIVFMSTLISFVAVITSRELRNSLLDTVKNIHFFQ